MQFQVFNRWSGKVQFTAEIDCADDASPRLKMGLAVKWALLSDTYLSGAVLRGADLRGVNLSHTDLRDAELSGADLRDTDLRDADLRGADLRGADLRSANLRDADLRGAVLSDAVLSDADLRGAVLSDAVLSDADLSGADLRGFKSDLWMTLTQNRNEVPAMLDALREGRVDGSTYSGECACLVGTIANIRGVSVETFEKNATNPAEQWFFMISRGDTPDKDTGGGFAAKMALQWGEEWCALNGVPTTAKLPA